MNKYETKPSIFIFVFLFDECTDLYMPHACTYARTHARTHIPVCVRVVIVLTTNHAQPTPWCAALLQAHMLRHGTTEAEVAAATPHQSYAVEAVGVYGVDGAAFDSTGPVITLPPLP